MKEIGIKLTGAGALILSAFGAVQCSVEKYESSQKHLQEKSETDQDTRERNQLMLIGDDKRAEAAIQDLNSWWGVENPKQDQNLPYKQSSIKTNPVPFNELSAEKLIDVNKVQENKAWAKKMNLTELCEANVQMDPFHRNLLEKISNSEGSLRTYYLLSNQADPRREKYGDDLPDQKVSLHLLPKIQRFEKWFSDELSNEEKLDAQSRLITRLKSTVEGLERTSERHPLSEDIRLITLDYSRSLLKKIKEINFTDEEKSFLEQLSDINRETAVSKEFSALNVMDVFLVLINEETCLPFNEH